MHGARTGAALTACQSGAAAACGFTRPCTQDVACLFQEVMHCAQCPARLGQANHTIVQGVTPSMVRSSKFQSCAHTCASSQVLRSALRRMPSVTTCASAYTASSWFVLTQTGRAHPMGFFMVRTSQAQSCRSCHLRHGAQQRFPFVRAYLRFLTGIAQRFALHAERDNLRQRIHSFFMVGTSQAQSCRSCHLRHGAQQRYPGVHAYLCFLTGIAQRFALHAERDNLRQRLRSFFMVRTSPAQSCRSCHLRHGAQQRFPGVHAYLCFLTGIAQRFALHAERDNLRQRIHSFFMVGTSQAQSCRSCHLRHGAQQRFPGVHAYLCFLTGIAQRFALHAERDNLRQRLRSFFLVRTSPAQSCTSFFMVGTSQAQSCGSCHLRHGAQQRFPVVRAYLLFLTGFAQRAAAHAERANLRQRLHSFFMVRASPAQRCRSCHLQHGAQQRFPVVRAYLRFLTGFAQRFALHAERDNLCQRIRSFFMVETSQTQSCRSCHLRHGAQQRVPAVRAYLRFLTGFAQRAAAHAERANLRQRLHSFFMVRTSPAQSCRSCHLRHGEQERLPAVHAYLRFLTGFAQRAAAHAERANLRQRLHSFFMIRTSPAQSCRSCHLRHGAQQRFPVVRAYLRFLTGFAQRAAAHAERDNLRQRLHSFFMVRTSQAQSCRSCHLRHGAQQRFPFVRAYLRFLTGFAQRAAAHAKRANLHQRLHSFFMVRASPAQSCRSCHLRHGAQQRFPVVRAYLRFLTGFAQRAAAHAERANLRQRLHSFFMVRASPAQRCRSCHLQHGAQQRFPVVRAYLRFLTGFAQRAATHAERDNFRQRLHSFFMVRASPAQSCRSCHVRHGAQQRFPVVRAYLRFLTGFAQRAAAHAERDNLRPRLHSFFMVRTSQAQSCRSCHLRHGAQQRFPFVCAYLRFPTGFAQRFAAHAERDNLRQRLHSFFMVRASPAQSCRSRHLRHEAQQRFPVVRAYLRFLTGFAQRFAAHAERDNLRQRLHSFFMVRTSQAQSCRSCHLRHGAQQRVPAVRAYLRFLTGFAQRAAAHAERANLRQRLHSFFMVRTSPAQSCRSCHLRHGEQERLPAVHAYLRFLTGFAQRAAAHAERANLRQRLHSFFMVRTSPAQSCRSCHLRQISATAISIRARILALSHRFCAARRGTCRA